MIGGNEISDSDAVYSLLVFTLLMKINFNNGSAIIVVILKSLFCKVMNRTQQKRKNVFFIVSKFKDAPKMIFF